MKKDKEVYSSIAKLLRLETMTMAGRVNLTFTVVLAMFAIIYTSSDKVCYLISAIRDTVKTIVLKQNISDSYQTVSIFKMVVPVIVLMIACMFYLYWDDKKKNEMEDKE